MEKTQKRTLRDTLTCRTLSFMPCSQIDDDIIEIQAVREADKRRRTLELPIPQ